MEATQECYVLFWTNPGSNTPQNSSCPATYLQSYKTIQIRWTTQARHCRRSKDELISDVLLQNPPHWCAKIGWRTKIYIHQFCVDTRCSLEDLPRVMKDRGRWQEWIRELCVVSGIWWWELVWIQSFLSPRHVSFTKAKKPSLLYYLSTAGEGNIWIHAFHKSINSKWNTSILDQIAESTFYNIQNAHIRLY